MELMDLTLSLCFPAGDGVEDGPQRRAECGGTQRWGVWPGDPLRCCAAAGVVNQAVTSRRTATSQHQGRTAPQFDHRPERSGGSCGRAGDLEQGMWNTSRPPPPEVKAIRCLPLKSEIEVRPLNIPVGLAPRPCPAVQHRAVLQRAQGIAGSHMVAACLHAV